LKLILILVLLVGGGYFALRHWDGEIPLPESVREFTGLSNTPGMRLKAAETFVKEESSRILAPLSAGPTSTAITREGKELIAELRPDWESSEGKRKARLEEVASSIQLLVEANEQRQDHYRRYTTAQKEAEARARAKVEAQRPENRQQRIGGSPSFDLARGEEKEEAFFLEGIQNDWLRISAEYRKQLPTPRS